jgi:hypothetical protein
MDNPNRRLTGRRAVRSAVFSSSISALIENDDLSDGRFRSSKVIKSHQ